jgi:secreted PhoX family phosphatase
MNGKEDREGFSRRKFIKGISMAAGSGLINTAFINNLAAQPAPAFKQLK